MRTVRCIARYSAHRRRFLLLFLLLLLIACADPVTRDPEVSPATGNLRLEEVATIGCPTCPVAEQLSVFAMGLDADGLIWAVDRYPPHMRIFRLAVIGPDEEDRIKVWRVIEE